MPYDPYYEVWMDDSRGNRQHLLTTWQELTWARRLNAVGAFTLKFAAGEFPRAWFALDNRVEVWRRPAEGVLDLLLVGFCRYLEQGTQGNDAYVVLGGPDANDLLARRIIAYAAGSAGASKSGYADNVAKAFVRENLGASAPVSGLGVTRDMSSLGFTVAADLSAGYNVLYKDASRQEVLKTVQEICTASTNLGSRLYFDVVSPTPDTFEFRTFVGQRGVDHRYPTSNDPVMLSAELGNLLNPVLVQDWRNEATYCYAAGQGEGALRLVVELQAGARILQSAWNTRETLFDGRNYADTGSLTVAGEGRLRELRPARKFSALMADTAGFRFGRDVGLGDLVTAIYDGEQYDCEIAAAGATMSADGEKLTVRLEYLA